MKVRAEKYPQLHSLCWNRRGDVVLDGDEALQIYERNWRFVDKEAMEPEEARLLDALVARCGRGAFMPA